MGAAPHTLMTLASFLGLKIKANVNVRAALPGEVLLNKNIASKARKWANDLFSEEKNRLRHRLPLLRLQHCSDGTERLPSAPSATATSESTTRARWSE